MAKQIMNVRDVMAVLEVSESKAYGILRQMNDELKAKGFITIPGKVPTAYFEEKVYGVHAEQGIIACLNTTGHEAYKGIFKEYI